MSDDAQKSTSPFMSAIGRLIGEFERCDKGQGSVLSKGDVSALRRMDLAQPPTAFWRLVAATGTAERADETRQWARIVKCMAIMFPHFHDPRQKAGHALRDAGYSSSSDLRISRLLKASGEPFEDYLSSAIRFLSNKAKPVNWFGFANFVFDDRDTEARNRLAREFYSLKKD